MDEMLTKWRAANPLRVWRDVVGCTQREVVARTGLGKQSVRDWEDGVSTPNLDSFRALACLSGLAVMDWVTRWDDWKRQRPGAEVPMQKA